MLGAFIKSEHLASHCCDLISYKESTAVISMTYSLTYLCLYLLQAYLSLFNEYLEKLVILHDYVLMFELILLLICFIYKMTWQKLAAYIPNLICLHTLSLFFLLNLSCIKRKEITKNLMGNPNQNITYSLVFMHIVYIQHGTNLFF